MPRAIKRIRTGLHHIAENRVIKLSRVHARTPNCLFRSVRRQLNRAHLRKRSRVPRHRRPRPRHNHHIRRKHTSLSCLSDLSLPIRAIVILSESRLLRARKVCEAKDLIFQRGNAPFCGACSMLHVQPSTFNCQLLFGVSSVTTVSPPRFRASSMENSARLIKSVTMSSLS